MNSQRHPFLDDLAEDVTLISSALRGDLKGREQVLKAVKAAGSLYKSQTPTFMGTVENRMLFQYESDLGDGLLARGIAAVVRNDTGEVTELQIAFSPLDAVLKIAAGIKEQLAGELPPEVLG